MSSYTHKDLRTDISKKVQEIFPGFSACLKATYVLNIEILYISNKKLNGLSSEMHICCC